MTKTLADMTPEERDQCFGMWCDTVFELSVLTALRTNEDGDEYGIFIRPGTNQWHTESFEYVTPRFDLPRAWSPDGTPVELDGE